MAICSRLQHETWWKLDEGSIQAIRTPFYFLNEPNQVGEPNVTSWHSYPETPSSRCIKTIQSHHVVAFDLLPSLRSEIFPGEALYGPYPRRNILDLDEFIGSGRRVGSTLLQLLLQLSFPNCRLPLGHGGPSIQVVVRTNS